MVVGAAHRVGFRVGKLRFNSIRAIAHLVQPGAARGSGAMRAVGAAPAQHLDLTARRPLRPLERILNCVSKVADC